MILRVFVFLLSFICLSCIAQTDDSSQADRKLTRKDKKLAKAIQQENATIQKKVIEPKSPYEIDSRDFAIHNKIDELILADIKKNNLTPANLASDAVFIRRVYIDLCGTIPTIDETKDFLADKSKNKREKLVDKLLVDERFTARLVMYLGDILRVKAEFPINLWPNAAQAYSRFLTESIAANMPYDKMVYKILTSEGSNFRVGEVNFFRAMQSKDAKSIASSVALSFMGMRFDKMSQAQQHNMPQFFERISYKDTKEWKEEIVFCDPAMRSPFVGTLPNGKIVKLDSKSDPRVPLAEWLTDKSNPYFSKAISNRVWFWLFGQAIESPVDDMFSQNKPINEPLLKHLADYLASVKFDLRKLYKYIVLSRTYQQSPLPKCDSIKALEHFAVYPTTRLDAEALIDIICKITNTSEVYASTTPEPYTKFPQGESAVALPDGSITTTFLELFGRPSRDTGLSTDRVVTPSASQKLHMINSWHIRQKIEQGTGLKPILKGNFQDFLNDTYITILSRYPTVAERQNFQTSRLKRPNNERGYINNIDTIWALFNSDEFITKH